MKKIIYLLVAILTVSVLSGCGCSTQKKPHPNVIITTEEPAPEYCGSWGCTLKTDDGTEYKLELDLNPDGSGRYMATSPEGETVADCQGKWAKNDIKIVFDLYDTVEDTIWRADFERDYDGKTLTLTHTRGKAFLEGTEDEGVVFTRR